MPRAKLISFLTALCLFLATIENAIPKPLPFLRLGLANVPIILTLFLLPAKKVLLLTLFKVLTQGVISGTLFSYIFLFSAGGSFASVFAMLALFYLGGTRTEKPVISAIGISLSGSLASTFAQLFLARFLLFGTNTKYIAPILLVSGLVTGCALGVFTELFIQKSKWFSSMKSLTKSKI